MNWEEGRVCNVYVRQLIIDISCIMMYKCFMRSLKKKPIQIYIEPQQNDVLEVLSQKKGVSKAELIRESLEKYLNELPLEEDPAMGLVGLGSSGRGDLSDQHDRYLIRYHSSKKK
jgi:hypothetical protein